MRFLLLTITSFTIIFFSLFPRNLYALEITIKRTVAMMPSNTSKEDYSKFHGHIGDLTTVSNEITNEVYMKSDNADSMENTINNPILHKAYNMVGRHKALYVSGVEDVPILGKHKIYTKNAMVRSDYSVELMSYVNHKADIRLTINDEVLSGNNRSGFMNIKGSNNTLLQAPVVAKAKEEVVIHQLTKGKEYVYYVLPKIEEDMGIQRMIFYQIAID